MDIGNFVSQTMRFTLNQPSDSEGSEDSDSESECNAEECSTNSEDSDTIAKDINESIFDLVQSSPTKNYVRCFKVQMEDICEIEKCLDLSEYVSLIFILIDDISYALQVMRSLIAAGPEKFSRSKLYEWACTSPEKWNYKLLEALAIVQNHKSLMKLGFNKKDINVMRDTPSCVNGFKKILYSYVCDYLCLEQAKDLIARIRCDGKFQEDITINCNPKYIEFHILFWIHQGYISIERKPYLDNLTKHLESANLIDLYKKINNEIKSVINKCNKFDQLKTTDDDDEEDCYKIKDPNNPGLVIIVDNANFSNIIERRNEFKHFPRLTDRVGSEKDVENLKKTFKALNYTVVVRNDIFHDRIVNEIHETVRKEFQVDRHSVLVLCVLSHGDEGVVYGANSVPIKNDVIINSVSGSSPLIHLLTDMPKIIIIQACQGKRKLIADPGQDLLEPDGARLVSDCPMDIDGDNLTVDGLKSYDPKDLVVCMATIKGFVALRSPANGTKYIQELCRCIEKYHNKRHFIDIMTIVAKNIDKEKCNVKDDSEDRQVCMVPEVTTKRLRKFLYLSPRHMSV